MKMRFCALLVLVGVVAPLSAQVAPARVVPADEVDERLFLVRALEATYDRWPSASSPAASLTAWIGATRAQLNRLQATVRLNKLDDVEALYRDALELLDNYETYLADAGAIERGAADRAARDNGAAAAAAFRAGMNAGAKAAERGEKAGDAIGEGLVVGLVVGALDGALRGWDRDRDRQERLQAAARRFTATATATRARAEVTVARLAEKHRWKAGEAGFDNFVPGKVNDLVVRRPRDPFALVRLATTEAPGETPKDVLTDAGLCERAAALVPAGKAYDVYRAEFLLAGAQRANLACARQIKNDYSNGPADGAKDAIRLCQLCLLYDPSDTTHAVHMTLARSLAMAGQYREAITAANKATRYHSDPYFAYRYARLMSLTDDTQRSLDWFAYAIRQGCDSVALARNDPDLQKMRLAKGAAFAELTRVRFSWNIDWGIINADEIVLTNTSGFAITDVAFDVRVTSTGNADWTSTLRCAYIPRGGKYTWKLDGRGITSRGWDARGLGSLVCAENR